jgi:capsular polysaccharide transport system permease protein
MRRISAELPPDRRSNDGTPDPAALGRPQRGGGGIWKGFVIQHRYLRALFVRDIMMRYGREHLGFTWVVLEPMLLTAGVISLWSVLRESYEHGVRLVEFVLTGYMLLTLWRHCTSSTILLLRRGVPLLYHRQVSVYDIFYSRMLVEFAGTTAALLFVLFTLLLVGVIAPIQDWSLVIAGWLSMAFLGMGAGALILVATERNETTEKLIQPIQYLLVPLSGTFFMVSWLPSSARELILVNPLVHPFEMVRSGFWGGGVEAHYSTIYVLVWGFVLNFLGLVGIHRIRRDLQIA